MDAGILLTSDSTGSEGIGINSSHKAMCFFNYDTSAINSEHLRYPCYYSYEKSSKSAFILL